MPGLPSETEIDGARLVLGQCLMASSQCPELFISAKAAHCNVYKGGCHSCNIKLLFLHFAGTVFSLPPCFTFQVHETKLF